MFNKKSRDEVIKDYLPLAKSMSRKFSTLSHEDRLQEALLALIKAYDTFNTDIGVSFGLYAKIVILNGLKRFYNKEISYKNGLSGEQVSEYVASDKSKSKMKFIEFLNDLKQKITSSDYAIFSHLLNGDTQKECSRFFGISQPSVSRAICRIKNFSKDLL